MIWHDVTHITLRFIIYYVPAQTPQTKWLKRCTWAALRGGVKTLRVGSAPGAGDFEETPIATVNHRDHTDHDWFLNMSMETPMLWESTDC